MNYLKQITSFYKSLISVSLSSNAQALYNFLLSVDNSLLWKEKFTSPNAIIMTYLNMNISALTRARNELVENGFLIYENGKRKDAGIYEIVKLYEEDDTENAEEMTQKCEEDETNVQQSCDESATKVSTYNKQNKIKENEIKEDETKENKTKTNEEKIFFGEYKNVFLSDAEYEKLKAENENYEELISFLDCYIEEKGYKTNNCYLAINRWVKKAVNEKNEKNENKNSKTVTKKGPLNNFKGPDIDFKALESSLMKKQTDELKKSEYTLEELEFAYNFNASS